MIKVKIENEDGSVKEFSGKYIIFGAVNEDNDFMRGVIGKCNPFEYMGAISTLTINAVRSFEGHDYISKELNHIVNLISFEEAIENEFFKKSTMNERRMRNADLVEKMLKEAGAL